MQKGFRSLLLLCMFSSYLVFQTLFLGWTHRSKGFLCSFHQKIEFHNLICIFNQARLCLRDMWIMIFDHFLLLMSTIVPTNAGLKGWFLYMGEGRVDKKMRFNKLLLIRAQKNISI